MLVRSYFPLMFRRVISPFVAAVNVKDGRRCIKKSVYTSRCLRVYSSHHSGSPLPPVRRSSNDEHSKNKNRRFDPTHVFFLNFVRRERSRGVIP